MNWLQRYRLRSFLRKSVWVAPTVGVLLAIGMYFAIGALDRTMGWYSTMSTDAARAVVATLASSLLTFIVFVLSAMLVTVQLASAQLTPRIIARAFEDVGVKIALGVFTVTFTFSLGLLVRIDANVPLVATRIGVWSSLLCICGFLYLVDRMAKALRPITILTGVANDGADVVRAVYPNPADESSVAIGQSAPRGTPRLEIEHRGRSGVLLAFDVQGLLTIARSAGGRIEIVPQVGDFVAHGDVLFRVFDSDVDARVLINSIAIGGERTVEQDPAFAMRIIVDIANKALSPAINDPTTAVLAVDQLHLLLRLVGLRRLDNGVVRDDGGTVRLVYRTPNWDDFVFLAVTEIRQFGAGSVQVMRRQRAMLQHLIGVLPPKRAALLQLQLELLDRSVMRNFPDEEDRHLALQSDLQGLGGSAVVSET